MLVVLGIGTYANSLWGKFYFDDRKAILANESIRGLWPPSRHFHAPQNATTQGRPVVSFTMALNYAVGKLDVRGYHAGNIAVHVLCALVLFGVVRRTLCGPKLRDRFGPAASGLALATAAIWLVHPLQTECINYVSQRSESLMGLFYLLTLYCAIRAGESPRPIGWGLATVLACALGMGCKQPMVTAPLMVLVYDLVFRTAPVTEKLRGRWSLYAGLAATWAILATLMISFPDTNITFSRSRSTFEYAFNQCQLVVDYLRQTLWPHPLAFDYGRPRDLSLWDVWPQAALLAALGALTIFALIRRPMLGFLGVWFFVVLSPTSNFIPSAEEVGAERRMYLPLAAPAVLAVMAGYAVFAPAPPGAAGGRRTGGWRPITAPLVATIVVLVMVAASALRNRDYRSAVSIWRTAVAAKPDNHRAHFNLGLAFAEEGKTDEAIVHYRGALKRRPNYPQAHFNLAYSLAAKGSTDEAIAHYQRAVEEDPDYAEAHQNLAIQLLRSGRIDAAIHHLRRSAGLQPDSAPVQHTLGIVLLKAGRPAQAILPLREALRMQPDHPETHLALGVALAGQGEADSAMGHFQEAIRLKPTFTDAHYHLGNLLLTKGQTRQGMGHLREAMRLSPRSPIPPNTIAWTLATRAEATADQVAEAIRLAERAAELTGRRDPAVLDTLAAAYAAGGQFDRAVAIAETAQERAVAMKADALARQIRERLALYRLKKPHRE